MRDVKAYELLLSSMLAKAGWNEEDHPRKPAGSGGGQFVSAGGGGGGGSSPGPSADSSSSWSKEWADSASDEIDDIWNSLPEIEDDDVAESLSEYFGLAQSGAQNGSRADFLDGIRGAIESLDSARVDLGLDEYAVGEATDRLRSLADRLPFSNVRKNARLLRRPVPRKLDSKLSVLPTREFKFVSAQTENGQMVFEGYGAVFGNVDSHGDIIEPGAFKSFLDRARTGDAEWPVMLLQHGGMMSGSAQDMTPIGVWEDIREDSNGLRVKGVLANTERGREVYELLRMKPRPAITGLSIGYNVENSSLAPVGSKAKRMLKSVNLAEISMVTFPSNGKARVTGTKMTARELEHKLTQDAGLTRSQARALMKQGALPIVVTRDADNER